jgi:hypothetical protein
VSALQAHALNPNAHHMAATGSGAVAVSGTQVVSVAVAGLGLSIAGSAVTLTSSAAPGASESILKSTSAGGLTLPTFTASTSLTTPSILAAANLTIAPAGDLYLNPTGNDVLPTGNYDINLGAINLKYLTLHAAELWVETLVAQETMATIGGRILVGPTTTLIVDVATNFVQIDVKHNNLASGDRIYLESDGKVEFMAVTSGPTAITGGYRYNVTRNLDGSGANQWYAGDAVFNTGQAGNGFIDLYSLRGVKAGSEYGPTIVGNVRNSSTFNDWSPRWAVGNLNGLYGYSSTTYGLAAGNAAGTWVGADASNGFRVMSGSLARLLLTTSGDLVIRSSSGLDVIRLDNDGTSYFGAPMALGTNGGIYQGSSGTFASPGTGMKLFNASGLGTLQFWNSGYSNANMTLDSNGIRIYQGQYSSGSYPIWSGYRFLSNANGSDMGGLYAWEESAGSSGPPFYATSWGGLALYAKDPGAPSSAGRLALNADESIVMYGVAGIDLRSNVRAYSGVTLTSSAPTLNVGSDAVSTGTCSLQIGDGRTGNGYAVFDMVGDATYTDYGFRILRGNTGPNTTTQLLHRGTGNLSIATQEAATMFFQTAATTRMSIGSAGEVAIGTTPQTGWALYVSGAVGINGVLNGQLRLVPGTAPTASTDSAGSQWDMRADANYIYIRVATTGNYWKRVALSTF